MITKQWFSNEIKLSNYNNNYLLKRCIILKVFLFFFATIISHPTLVTSQRQDAPQCPCSWEWFPGDPLSIPSHSSITLPNHKLKSCYDVPVDGPSTVLQWSLKAHEQDIRVVVDIYCGDSDKPKYHFEKLETKDSWKLLEKYKPIHGCSNIKTLVSIRCTSFTQNCKVYGNLFWRYPVASSAPHDLEVIRANTTSFDLKWIKPDIVCTGSEIKQYLIRVTEDSRSQLIPTHSAETSYHLSRLSPGTKYSIKVRAKTVTGLSSKYSNSILNETRPDPTSPPGIPSYLRVEETMPHSIKLRWGSPSRSGGSPVDGFKVMHSLADADDSHVNNTTTKCNATSTTITNLSPATSYHFYVAAVNSFGTGSFRGPVNAKTSPLDATHPHLKIILTIVGGSVLTVSCLCCGVVVWFCWRRYRLRHSGPEDSPIFSSANSYNNNSNNNNIKYQTVLVT